MTTTCLVALITLVIAHMVLEALGIWAVLTVLTRVVDDLTHLKGEWSQSPFNTNNKNRMKTQFEP